MKRWNWFLAVLLNQSKEGWKCLLENFWRFFASWESGQLERGKCPKEEYVRDYNWWEELNLLKMAFNRPWTENKFDLDFDEH